MMKALMFVIVLSFLVGFVALIDTVIYKSYYFPELLDIITIKPGTDEWMVYVFLFIGFIHTLFEGIKKRLQKSGRNS